MKVWITRYALTKGIYQADVENLNDGDGTVRDTNRSVYNNLYRRSEYREDREEAIKLAEYMKTKKINTLRNQLAKVEAITFE